jgi:hypothetical protein
MPPKTSRSWCCATNSPYCTARSTTQVRARRPSPARCGQPGAAQGPLVLHSSSGQRPYCGGTVDWSPMPDLPASPDRRPALNCDIPQLIVRLAKENPRWGDQPIQGELLHLGVHISATAIRTTLRRSGLDPTPRRTNGTWWAFRRQQAAGIVACDLLHRRHGVAAAAVGAVPHRTGHPPGASRRVTANPKGSWVTQQARNLLLVLGEWGRRRRFLVRDHDAKFSRSFNDVFRSEGGEVVVTPVRAPRANAYAERWVPRPPRAGPMDLPLDLPPALQPPPSPPGAAAATARSARPAHRPRRGS